MLAFALPLMLALAPQATPQAVFEKAIVFIGGGRPEESPQDEIRARLTISGLVGGKAPRLRCWRMTDSHLFRMKQGTTPRRTGATLLSGRVTQTEGAFEFAAPWQGGVRPDECMVVEVFLGKRRIAWTEVVPQVRRRRGGRSESE